VVPELLRILLFVLRRRQQKYVEANMIITPRLTPTATPTNIPPLVVFLVDGLQLIEPSPLSPQVTGKLILVFSIWLQLYFPVAFVNVMFDFIQNN
jgi:hypothetical protein